MRSSVSNSGVQRFVFRLIGEFLQMNSEGRPRFGIRASIDSNDAPTASLVGRNHPLQYYE
jgi:hypothetical protein